MANAIIWVLVSAHRVCISDLKLSNGLFLRTHYQAKETLS
jgi:hypothetical protein